jgi:hypothetical protein
MIPKEVLKPLSPSPFYAQLLDRLRHAAVRYRSLSLVRPTAEADRLSLLDQNATDHANIVAEIVANLFHPVAVLISADDPTPLGR